MAFLRAEKKKTGTYLRIVESYKEGGKSRHRTLYSLGKVEDYAPKQLERIGQRLIELGGGSLDEFFKTEFEEIGRYNYGYGLIIKHLWLAFDFPKLENQINNNHKTQFEWSCILRLMIAERINEPRSKLQNFFNQDEYLGFGSKTPLHQFYRTLDLLYKEENRIKNHIFQHGRSLFSTVLDVVFYDVTTLYFDSQVEQEGKLRQKGYSKDGKARKTQIVLGLLVDKDRNPITYQIYQGNTYEGGTMIDILKEMKKQYTIDKVVIVADTAMIDKTNREFMVAEKLEYIIGDSIKKLPKKIAVQLIDASKHTKINESKTENTFTYREIEHQGRRIICTYSAKRAKKDAYERQKLLDKANAWIANPSKYKNVKKRGAGRYITISNELPELNHEKIKNDSVFDGYKALSTTTKLGVQEILSKYSDLFEVEHSFRALKSQLEIRPMFHWNDERIRGHIVMCFIAFTFLNHLKNATGMQYKSIIKGLDSMQMSLVKDKQSGNQIYLRSKIDENQSKIAQKFKLDLPQSANTQNAVNQYFI